MEIEIILSPKLFEGRILQDNITVVAVDILRATTSICAAFQAGVEEVVPLNSLDPLASFYKRGYTVAAERGGAKIVVEGVPASCGNSPTEYLAMDLNGQRLAYSTTNGTVSLLLAAPHAERLFVGSFSNLSALSQHLMASQTQNLVILCSGWKGDPCIEDTLFAGALVDRILGSSPSAVLVNDAALYAVDLWHLAKDDLYAFCSKATHVHRLQKMNYDHDIRMAFQLDTCPVVPQWVEGEKLSLVK